MAGARSSGISVALVSIAGESVAEEIVPGESVVGICVAGESVGEEIVAGELRQRNCKKFSP